MANPEHVEVIKRGNPKEIERYKHQKNLEVWDLSGEDFSEIDLIQINLVHANLEGATFGNVAKTNFHKANLKHARFQDGKCDNADFSDADMADAEFINVSLEKSSFQQAKLGKATFRGCTGQFVLFTKAQLSGAIIENCSFPNARASVIKLDILHTFEGVDFERSTLDQATFRNTTIDHVNFRECNLRLVDFSDSTLKNRCNFFEANLESARFEGCEGLHTAKNLEKTDNRHAYNLDACKLDWQERWFNWEIISGFGRINFLGVSYSALALIIAYVYAVDYYNENVRLLKGWASSVVERSQELSEELSDPVEIAATKIHENLYELEPPWEAGWLVTAFGFLAIASTLYQWRCPPVVKEFRAVHWRYALGRPLLHYWPLSWKERWVRIICASCYLAGAIIGIFLVAYKVGWVANYLITHNS